MTWTLHPLPPIDRGTPDTRRTERRRKLLASGLHPLMKGPLTQADGATCGNCAHLVTHHHDRRWYKCAFIGGGSPATDVRVKWPGCAKWKCVPTIKLPAAEVHPWQRRRYPVPKRP